MHHHGHPLIAALLAVTLAFGASAFSGRAEPGLAQGLERLTVAFSEKRFIAYTPTGFNPLEGGKAATEEAIRADLEVLKPYFDVLVTYSVNADQGLDRVVPLAEDNRLQVVLGIWDPKSVAEIARAVTLAHSHPDTVLAMIVGNETMLRGGNLEEVAQAIELIRHALPGIPLATSEPISDYGNQELRDLGDFHAPNFHWIFNGGDPENPTAAVDWLNNRVTALADFSPENRPILIKESGLSSSPPPFTEDLQKAYWSLAMEAFPPSTAVSLVVFEGFDLEWKSKTNPSEFGAAEAHWGLWTSDRKPKAVMSLFEPRQAVVDRIPNPAEGDSKNPD